MALLSVSLLLAAAALQAPSAGTGDGVGDAQYRACMEPAVAGSDMRACGDEWLERLDARLNAEWRAVLPLIDADGRNVLVEEQRSWVRFKDQSCAYLTDHYGSLAVDVQFPACRAEIIAARIAELQTLRAFLAENR